MRSVKFLFFIVLQLYTITLFLYTTHGVYKSYVEFFCKHRRPDTPDYTEKIYTNYINTTNFDKSSNSILSCYNNQTHRLIENGSILLNHHNNGADPDGFISFPLYRSDIYEGPMEWTYEKSDSYFKLTCQPSKERYISFSVAWKNFTLNDSLYYSDFVSNLYKSEMSPLEPNELGYLRHSPNEIYYIQSSLNLSMIKQKDSLYNGFMCELKKSPYTCLFDQAVTNKFFVLYLASSILLILTNFLLIAPYRRFIFKRLAFLVFKTLNSSPYELRFCNPITGDPFKYSENDELTVLDNCSSELNTGKKLEYLKDKDGEYFFTSDSSLVIKCNDLKGVFDCDDSIKDLIQRYFFMVYMDPNKCVCTEKLNHFMKTYEVLQKILDGQGLKFIKPSCSGYILDVHEYEFELIKKLFDIKKSTLKILMEHNWRFFGEKYQLPALMNCLRDKVWFYNKPKDVKNSQWKMYLSDYSRFIEGIKGTQIKAIHRYAPTKHYNDLKDTDPDDIEIIPITTVEIKMNKPCVQDKLNPVIKDAIYNEISRIKHNPCKYVPISEEIKVFQYDEVSKVIKGEGFEDSSNKKMSYKDVLEIYQKKAIEYLHDFPKEFKKVNEYLETKREVDPGFIKFKNHYESEIVNLEGTIKRLSDKNEVKGNMGELLNKQKRILGRKKQALSDLIESKKGDKGKLKFTDAQYLDSFKQNLEMNMVKIVCYDELLSALEEYEKNLDSKLDSDSFYVTKKDILDYCLRPKRVPGQANKKMQKKKQNKKSSKKSNRLIATFHLGSMPKNKYVSSNFQKSGKFALKMLDIRNAIIAKDPQQTNIRPNKLFIKDWPSDLKCKEIYTFYKMYENLSDTGYKKLCNPTGVELKEYEVEHIFSKPYYNLMLKLGRNKQGSTARDHVLYDRLRYIIPNDELVTELIEIII